jgi:hypothetical protein
MAAATYQQTNFLGGEWSPFFQGRSDHPKYKTAMNLSRNGFPLEEGAWTRRPGSRLCGPTRKGQAAKLYPIWFTTTAPYTAEFTDDALRFFNNTWPVITPEFVSVMSISTANPAVMRLGTPIAWPANDEIAFLFVNADITAGHQLRQRTFLITPIAETYAAWSSVTTYGIGDIVTSGGITYVSLKADNLNKTPATNAAWWVSVPAGSTRTYSLKDSVTGLNLDGSTVSFPGGCFVMRALKLTTPYSAGSWETARIVQNEDIALVVNGTQPPQALTITPNLGSPIAAEASIKAARFLDGPYFDPIKGSVATVSGLTGVVTVTIKFQAWDVLKTYAVGDYVSFGSLSYKAITGANLGNSPDTSTANWVQVGNGYAVTGPNSQIAIGFQSTDVGRLIRLLSEPPDYNSGTNYAKDVVVKYADLYYKSVEPVSNVQPDTDPTKWAIDPSAAVWTWAQITAVTNANTVDAQVMGDALKYAGVDVRIWRLGVYSDTTGYPTCGVFCEGRFWLGGSQPNRFDTTYVDGVDKDGQVNMAPTLPDGTVTDACGISYKFEAEDQNPIHWFANDHLGIIAGTDGGEWLISASQLNDPFTPTSIQARRVTKYKCADIEPKRTGIALLFVQKFKRRILEMLADVFSGRFTAPHLTETAKHLTQGGIAEIGYQEELAPILWFRDLRGKLRGATYRRTSAFTTETPAFVGFHRHDLGHARIVESMAVGPSNDGSLDALSFVTKSGDTVPVRYVEQFTTLFDEEDVLFDAWFLDGAIVPDQYGFETLAGHDGMRFTGLWYLAGKAVSIFVAGLDVGDFTVDADGSVFVPFGTGIDPKKYDYTAAGAGAWKFTRAYVDEVLAMSLVLRNGGVSVTVSEVITSKTVNPNPNGSTSKIQSFLPAETIRTDAMVMDWGTNNLMFVKQGSDSIVKFNAANGVEVGVYLIDTIIGGTGNLWIGNGIGDTDREGALYLGTDAVGGNYVPLVKIDDTTMTLVFKYGAGSTFGPPSNPGMPHPSGMAVAEANAPWVVTIGTSTAVTINSGGAGTFIAGNASTQDAFKGFNKTVWGLETGGGSIDAGAPVQQNNAAATYIVQSGNGWPATLAYFFVGAADGVPNYAHNTVNPGSTGKKGKGKKGASSGGVDTIPTVAKPQTFFGKIGTLAASTVNPFWTNFSGWDGCVSDWSDNSVITTVVMSQSGISAWSINTVYNFTTTAYVPWVAGSYLNGAFLRGTVLTNNTAVLYQANKDTIVDPEAVGQVDWNVVGIAYLAYDNAHTYVTGDYTINAGVLYKASQLTTGNAPPNVTYWTLPTTSIKGLATQGTRLDNAGRVWHVGLKNHLGGIDPQTDVGTSSFPQTGTIWNEVPTTYCVAFETGQYDRKAAAIPNPANTNTGSMKWAVPLNVNPIFGQIGAQGRLHGGLFGIASSKQDTTGNLTVWLIDTTTGKWFAGEVPGVKYHGGASMYQAWDDQTESFIFSMMDYTSTVTGSPTGLNGTATFTEKWARLYVGNLVPSTTITATLTDQPTTYTFIFSTPNTGGIPCVVGHNYVSQGQTLRVIAPEQSGARNGPAFGKTRRNHLVMALLQNTIGILFGNDFTAKGLTRQNLKDPDSGTSIPPDQMFSGMWRNTIESPYDFDAMLAWEIRRPYPASVVSIGAAIHTQDL